MCLRREDFAVGFADSVGNLQGEDMPRASLLQRPKNCLEEGDQLRRRAQDIQMAACGAKLSDYFQPSGGFPSEGLGWVCMCAVYHPSQSKR